MTIGILETGRPPRALIPEWGTYDTMSRHLLGAREYRTFDVPAGELPAAPDECEAYLITGSSAGVYEDHPWLPPLFDFLRAARGRAKLVGICFGHQAIAQAFGGRVEKSPAGWGLGLSRYEIEAPGAFGGEAFSIPAFHQDQVVALPPGATVLAHSTFTRYAALGYGDDAISVQGHPEFSAAFSAALIETLRDRYGPLADPALRSLQAPNDGPRVGRWFDRFIDGARPAAVAA